MLTIAPLPPALVDAVRRPLEQAHAAQRDLHEALRHARVAWQLAQSMPQLEQAASGHALLYALHRSGQLVEAHAVSGAVLAAVRPFADGAMALAYRQCLRWSALSAADIGHFNEALALATELYEHVQSRGLEEERPSALSLLGVAFDRSGDSWQAARLLREAASLACKLDERETLLVALNNLVAVLLSQFDLLRESGETAQANGLLDEAFEFIEEVVTLLEGGCDPYLEALILTNIGEVHLHRGALEASQNALNGADRLARAGRYECSMVRICYVRGELALAKNDAESALRWLNEARRALLLFPVETTSILVERAMYRAHRQLGDLHASMAALERTRVLELARARRQLLARSEFAMTHVEASEKQREVLDGESRAAQECARRAEAMTRLAFQDPLTGLANRRALDDYLERALDRAAIRRLDVSVIMIDLDRFKQINDRFGHVIGDKVLQRVAETLVERARPGDLVARPGGEEFVIVLEGVNATHALTLVENMRLAVANLDWHQIAEGLSVSFSAGIACYPHVSRAELLEQADLQMYRAKRTGGNRVSVAP